MRSAIYKPRKFTNLIAPNILNLLTSSRKENNFQTELKSPVQSIARAFEHCVWRESFRTAL